MASTMTYLSNEWRDEAEKRIRADLSPERMNKITSSMSNIYKNCPDGKERYLFFNFKDGELVDLLVGEGEAPKAEYRITGDYDIFAQISRAELSSQKALMTGKLKLKGNMVKALKLASVADRLNRVISTIPAEY